MKKLIFLTFVLVLSSCSNIENSKIVKVLSKLDKNFNKISDRLETISIDKDINVFVAYKNQQASSFNLIYVNYLKTNLSNIHELVKSSDVVFIEENFTVNIDLLSSTKQIGARQVWSNGYTGQYKGASTMPVRIAVVDTGIDTNHEDFTSRIYKSINCMNVEQCVSSGANDDHSHGTHVAGIVLGSGASCDEAGDSAYFEYMGNFQALNTGLFSYFPAQFKDDATTGTISAKITWQGTQESGFRIYTKSAIDNDASALKEASATKTNSTLGVDTVDDDYITDTTSNQTAISSSNLVNPYVFSAFTTNSSLVGNTFFAQVKTIVQGWDDGLPRMAGVSYESELVSIKALDASGSGSILDIIKALEYVNANAETDKVIAVNMSFSMGAGMISAVLDSSVNSLIDNGVAVIVSSGNAQGTSTISSPGLAQKAITVGAVNNLNQITDYSSIGSLDEDYVKPDLVAPGGSTVTKVYIAGPKTTNSSLSLWNSTTDAALKDPYTLKVGTSQAAPHVAGLIGLMASKWTGGWTYGSSQMPLFFKMLLCMTAYEVGAGETGAESPGTPERAGALNDVVEGYGMISAEGVMGAFDNWDYNAAASDFFSFSDVIGEQKTFTRAVTLQAATEYNFSMSVPTGSDFDLYLFASSSDENGNPVLLASSALYGNPIERIIDFIPTSTGTYYMVAKHISGNGSTNIVLDYSKPASINVMQLSNFKYIKNMKEKRIDISWDTNLPALSTIQYGTTGGLGTEQIVTEYKTSHSFSFNIEYENNYYFRVLSSSTGSTEYEISTAVSSVYKADAHTTLRHNPLVSELPTVAVGGCGSINSMPELPNKAQYGLILLIMFLPFGILFVMRCLSKIAHFVQL